MKQFIKKGMSLILCLAMIFGTVSVVAFAKEESAEIQTNRVANDYEISSNTAMGAVLTQAMEEYGENVNNGYSIGVIRMNGETATVTFSNTAACKLVVAIYDGNGKMLGAGVSDVEADAGTADIAIEIDKMPEYYTVKGFLLDENLAPLCSVYETKRYTKEFQEFLNKTVDDFSGQEVVNFDNSNKNNFAVLPDGSEVVEQSGEANRLLSSDAENGIYIFENADSSITTLSAGEVFYFYNNKSNESFIIKVKSVVTQGNKTTVTAEDAELEELFTYIKISDGAYANENHIDTSAMDDGVTYLGAETEKKEVVSSSGSGTQEQAVIIDSSGKGETKFNLGLDKEWKTSDDVKIKIGGKFSISLAAELEVFYDFKLLGADYLEISFAVEEKTSGTISFSVGVESMQELGFPVVNLPLAGGAIIVKVEPSFGFAGKANAEFGLKKEDKIGFSYDSNNGYKEIKSSKNDIKPVGKVEAEIKFGIQLSASLTLVAVLELKVTAGAGIMVTAALQVPSLSPDTNERHLCEACIDGDIGYYLEAKFNVKLDLGKGVSWTPVDKSLSYEKNLGDFYISIIGSATTFKWGDCPNIAYLVTFTVNDKNGDPIMGAEIDCDSNDRLEDFNGGKIIASTDSSGKATYYYTNGDYTVEVNAEGYQSESRKINVKRKPQAVEFELSDARKVIDSGYCGKAQADGTPGTNLTYVLYSDGELVISGKGEMMDWNRFGTDETNNSYYGNSPWFNNRYAIKKVIINEGVTSAGDCAFYRYECVVDISFPDSLTTIGNFSFSHCPISTVTVPLNVVDIGRSSFGWCENLVEVSFNAKNASVEVNSENDSFPDVETIKIGAYVEKYRHFCFMHAERYLVDSNNKILSNDNEGVLFNKDKTSLISFPSLDGVDSYTIPNFVVKIEDCAFSNTYLKSIAIPVSVSSISEDAFVYCWDLTDIYYEGTESQWNSLGDVNYLSDVTVHFNSSMPSSASIMSVSGEQAISGTQASAVPSSVTYSGCAGGNSYVILNVSGYSGSFELTDKNLLYIEEVTADSSGKIKASVLPKHSDSTSFVLLAGSFSDSVTEHRVIYAPQTPVFTSSSIALNYKQKKVLPINGADVTYVSSDPSVVSVDKNGNITALKTGKAVITAYVNGTDYVDTCTVTITYSFWQMIIRILLLGFLWY